MTEILFYHLQRQPLEKVLPSLLEKSLQRGWRCVVQGGSKERLGALDTHLWTFADDSFLPHGLEGGEHSADQPVLLSENGSPAANAATVRFIVDSLPLPQDIDQLSRLVLLFDGNDAEAVDHARLLWKEAKLGAHEMSYWQQSEAGRWEKKA